jgi:hypothetical protein
MRVHRSDEYFSLQLHFESKGKRFQAYSSHMVPRMKAAATRLLPLLAIIPACALGGDDGSSVSQAIGGTASISLSSSSAAVTLTSDAQWTLSKTGSLSGNTVTWNITATKTATVSGQLVVQGQLTVTNNGSGPATIGNIVANLQTKSGGTWKTVSSDVANATLGDDATTAKIHSAASSEGKSSFTENSASGKLEFMDATNNTVFSLVPEVSINPGQSRTLLFQAQYNNNILHLATGTAIRAEVIVSFGNATANGNSTPNVDINGNGQLDWDEARVRSVPSRLGLSVPPQTNGNATPTLTDALSDITTTGTVTHGSVWFNLGATSGTVTTTVNGGASGGTITNCAHLTAPGYTVTSGGFTFTNVNPINLQSCNQQTIGAVTTCTPGDAVCRWHQGDLETHTQFGFDTSTSWLAAYDAAYAGSFGEVEVGIPGTGGFSARFTSSTRVTDYFVAAGTVGALNADIINPTTTSSGAFGGEVLALELNVDFSSTFASTHLCGMADTSLNGMSVSSVLAIANTLLGGGSNGYTIAAISTLASDLNGAFSGGTPSTFAQDHLYVGACP